MATAPIFIYHTTLGQSLEAFANRLNHDEQSELATFTNSTRRQSFIAGRLLLATALKKHHGETDYRIIHTSQGKPCLQTPHHWHFNLTHSNNHLYLALQAEHPIGIDCEVIRARPYQRIAKKLFSPSEYQNIITANDPLIVFFYYWTRYEAKIKYAGKSVFSKPFELNNAVITSYRHQGQMVSICYNTSSKPCQWYHCDMTE